MKIEIHNTLHEKAKTRKDGIYSYKYFLYVVKNCSFIAYADYWGDISSVHGAFHYHVGKVEKWDRKSKLKELFINTKNN